MGHLSRASFPDPAPASELLGRRHLKDRRPQVVSAKSNGNGKCSSNENGNGTPVDPASAAGPGVKWGVPIEVQSNEKRERGLVSNAQAPNLIAEL